MKSPGITTHGTNGSYVRGCRCDDCRQAHAAYAAAHRKAHPDPDAGYVPADQARAHLLLLASHGVGLKAVNAATDIGLPIIIGVRNGSRLRLQKRTEKKILAVTPDLALDHALVDAGPTWQRINYIMTAYKPSNYTKAKGVVASGNSAYDRFMVPPMFMLTMGDLYRDQPILIQSVTLTIPDDASWETYNEDNVGKGNWAYMANLIAAPKAKFGQVPREVELGFTSVLLEKERAVVGGANFGHAPRTEEFKEWNDNTVPDGKDPNDWNKNYVVNVIKGS